MTHLTKLDLEWERIIRSLTAWEAVRSSPEYRKNWEENKKYVTWWNNLPEEKKGYANLFSDPDSKAPEVEIWRWLVGLGKKWNFKTQWFLTDPNYSVPFKERRDYNREKSPHDQAQKNFSKEVAAWTKKQREWQQEVPGVPFSKPFPRLELSEDGQRAERWLQLVSSCPYGWAESLGVFLQWPYRAWVESQPSVWAEQRRAPELRFDERERGAGRIVLWVSLELTPSAALEEIKRALKLQWEKAERDQKRDPREIRSRDILHHRLSTEFLILGADVRAGERAVMKKLKPLMKKFSCLSDFESRIGNLWEGLDIYRHQFVNGLSKREAIKSWLVAQLGENDAAEELKRHQTQRRIPNAQRSAMVQRAERRLEAAKQFVEQKKYTFYLMERGDIIPPSDSPTPTPPVLPV